MLFKSLIKTKPKRECALTEIRELRSNTTHRIPLCRRITFDKVYSVQLKDIEMVLLLVRCGKNCPKSFEAQSLAVADVRFLKGSHIDHTVTVKFPSLFQRNFNSQTKHVVRIYKYYRNTIPLE